MSIMPAKKKRQSKRCIGLYICLDAFYISQSVIKDNRIKVERFVKVPLAKIEGGIDAGPASAMNVDFFMSERVWLEPLQNIIDKVKWDTKDIAVTLSPSFAVIRHFVMPFVERRFWRQSVPFEAKKYVPFSFEESIYDYFVYRFKDEQSGAAKLGVVFALTDKKISSAVSAGIDKLGLNLTSIEVSAVSSQRFFDVANTGKTSDGVFHAHFDESSAYFLLSNNSVVLLFRVANFGQSQMTERRRLGLRGSIDFIHKQLGSKIYEEIHLSGVNLDFWKNAVEEDTKLKVKICQPGTFVNMKNTDWGTYASLGASIRQAMYSASDIDIRANVKEGLDTKAAVSFLWKTAAAVTLVFLAFFLYYQFRLSYLNIRISRAGKDTGLVAELKELSAGEIKSYITGFEERLELISAVNKEIAYFTPKLEAVVDSIPSRVWLENISYSHPVRSDTGRSSPDKMIISGYLSAKNKEEELALANEFKDRLQDESDISSIYKVNLVYETSSDESTNGYSSFKMTFTNIGK